MTTTVASSIRAIAQEQMLYVTKITYAHTTHTFTHIQNCVLVLISIGACPTANHKTHPKNKKNHTQTRINGIYVYVLTGEKIPNRSNTHTHTFTQTYTESASNLFSPLCFAAKEKAKCKIRGASTAAGRDETSHPRDLREPHRQHCVSSRP